MYLVVAGPRACHLDQSNNGQPQGGDPTEARLSFVVAGPRACQTDQTKSGQPQGVDPTEERLSFVVAGPRACLRWDHCRGYAVQNF